MTNSMTKTSAGRGEARARRLLVGRLGLVSLAIVALLIAGSLFDLRAILTNTLRWIEALDGWGVVLFILIYVGATVFFLPGSVLTLGAGAAFGVVHGSIYVSIASTLGATAAFLVGRYVARDSVGRMIDRYPAFAAVDRAVAAEGWKIVGLTRLSPVFPFSLLNYAFGVTQVRLRDYVIASWLGMMPGTVMYVYVGSLAQVGGGGTHRRTPAEWALYGLGLLATVVVTLLITRSARRALAQRTQSP